MWKWLAVLVVLGIAADAAAQPRPNTLQMSCRQAQALVVSHGAIVLGTGPNRYERYVRDQSFCPVGMRTETLWIRRLILRHAPSDTALETQARSGPAPETLRRITERNSVVMTAALGERPYKGKLAVAQNARTGERSH